ncbi:phosphoribosyl-ATP diphosphatase [Haladaptatus sp. F3-133]|jgi:phosphoribosyl-ATP pyrophosphohydrolase|uniref:Phosphoribosyl-ATP pyrophosphatase n=1 Tax=Halorutilus salinus TaxID=2487751 RepID=A0A9Q4C4P7_9EURY|nr:phosphoribosyl-ATP diphosphatase [Halorutilus salinus]MCX2819223.1 phosphoribosyl-ATP diphosphatase [Halorutilus salinus]
MTDTDIFEELYEVIEDRRDAPREDSYTSSLLEEGVDAPLEKLGEEATEVTLAAKNDDTDELVHESADLIYHLYVVLTARDIELEEVVEELEERRG